MPSPIGPGPMVRWMACCNPSGIWVSGARWWVTAALAGVEDVVERFARCREIPFARGPRGETVRRRAAQITAIAVQVVGSSRCSEPSSARLMFRDPFAHRGSSTPELFPPFTPSDAHVERVHDIGDAWCDLIAWRRQRETHAEPGRAQKPGDRWGFSKPGGRRPGPTSAGRSLPGRGLRSRTGLRTHRHRR